MKKKLYAFLLAAFFVTTSVFAVDLTSGLKLHYTFDDVDGTAVTDASGNGYSATLMGAATILEGKTGNAVNLTNVEDYVLMPEGVLADVTNFTIACWINVNDFQYWGRVFDFGSGQEINTFMAPLDGHFKFVIKKDATVGEQALTATVKAVAGEWTHLAVTGEYNENGEGTVKFYVNGALAGTSTTFTSTPASMGVTTQNYLGKSQYPDPTINGKIDDFRVYTRALTQEDMMVMNGYPVELINAYNTLSIGNTVDITANLTLPATQGTDGVTVTWKSSDTLVVENDGTIHQLDRFRAAATLTATLTYVVGTDTSTVVKMFDVVVYPKNAPLEIIATWNFLDENIKRDSLTTVVDETSGYIATCMGGADIVPIGTDEVFNVVSIGSESGQYVDLGQDIGQAIYGLTDYTVSLFFRKDTTDGSAASWYSEYGKHLYAFSNTNDMEAQKVGGMYFEPRRARHVCTPDNYGSEGTANVGVGEKVTPQGSWHSVVYSQTSGVGILYFDGIQVATAAMPNPGVALKKNVTGRTGTNFNYLGRPTYKNDPYLKNALLYGFELYSVGLTADDLEDVLGIQAKIASLDLAYENTNYDVKAYMALMGLLGKAETAVAVGYEPGLGALNA
ncbi:MAG: LamG domain-containing protein, partial [Bacteroidales bacterium]|nr:LamG domain-containing protein [Bacteroidales bacterium]